jgi:hypothetical protein
MFSYGSAARFSAPTIGDSRPSRFGKNRTHLAGSQISGPDHIEKTGRGAAAWLRTPTTVTGRSGDVRDWRPRGVALPKRPSVLSCGAASTCGARQPMSASSRSNAMPSSSARGRSWRRPATSRCARSSRRLGRIACACPPARWQDRQEAWRPASERPAAAAREWPPSEASRLHRGAPAVPAHPPVPRGKGCRQADRSI